MDSSNIRIIALVLGIIATVLAFFLIVPEKKKVTLNKFGKVLHDTLNFKFLIIEKILQALYIFVTAYIILYGFFYLFHVRESFSFYGAGIEKDWDGYWGLVIMILGPVVIRLMFEASMLLILLVKNVIRINNKLKSENGEAEEELFSVPKISFAKSQAAPVAQTATFCIHCGGQIDDGKFCPHCGKEN